MSAVFTATPPPASPPPRRVLTAADLAALPSELPSGPAKYELDNGELIIMSLPGDEHGAVQANFLLEFKRQGTERGYGKARGEVGIILWRNPDRVVGPEALFVANSSLPLRLSREGYLETIPDVVVEVRSKTDTQPEVDHKVADYLKAGVKLVWVADPAKEIVTEYRPGQAARVFTIDDTLTVDDIIPGFQMPVRRVFEI